MRNVLVVAYYFPPMGLSGVQRVAKFVKYLPEFGWRPVVLTVEPGGYFAYDHSLQAEIEQAGIEVHRTYSLDPTRLFGRAKTVALPSEPSRKRFSLLSQFAFIPDNKLGWLYPALKRGRALLRARRFDLIFSSAPPYTGHLIAQLLSAGSSLPLVTDFRDDWVGNPRHVYPTVAHRRLHERLERGVLRASTLVVTINDRIADSLKSRSKGLAVPVVVIPQGYDAADFSVAPKGQGNGKMLLLHSGIFYDKQTPDVFLEGLASFLRRRPDALDAVEATFVGLIPDVSLRKVKALGLECIKTTGYVPHIEVPAYLRAADVLWMTIGAGTGAECISTGKLFEYMGARKPILALVPSGAARDALLPYEGATVVPPDDPNAISCAIEALYDRWRVGTLPEVNEEYVRRFDRRTLTGDLARLFDTIIAGRSSAGS